MVLTLIEKQQLLAARRELGLTQQQLAERAHVARRTITSIEDADGSAQINYSTAMALVTALNGVRKERGIPLLNVEDIDWRIRG